MHLGGSITLDKAMNRHTFATLLLLVLPESTLGTVCSHISPDTATCNAFQDQCAENPAVANSDATDAAACDEQNQVAPVNPDACAAIETATTSDLLAGTKACVYTKPVGCGTNSPGCPSRDDPTCSPCA